MQTVSASIGIERHNPPIVEQPYQSTWPIGLSSRVKCHASQVTLGSLTTRDLLFYRPSSLTSLHRWLAKVPSECQCVFSDIAH